MEFHYYALFSTLVFGFMLPSISGDNENIIAGIEDYGDKNAGNANAGAAMEAYNPELLEA